MCDDKDKVGGVGGGVGEHLLALQDIQRYRNLDMARKLACTARGEGRSNQFVEILIQWEKGRRMPTLVRRCVCEGGREVGVGSQYGTCR